MFKDLDKLNRSFCLTDDGDERTIRMMTLKSNIKLQEVIIYFTCYSSKKLTANLFILPDLTGIRANSLPDIFPPVIFDTPEIFHPVVFPPRTYSLPSILFQSVHCICYMCYDFKLNINVCHLFIFISLAFNFQINSYYN